jgi:hypothetical protein
MVGAGNPEAVRIRRFCVAFAVVFLFRFWLSGWRYVFETSSHAKAEMPEPIEDVPPMPTIATPEEFDIVLKCRCCVIFVDADWSFEAVAARKLLVYPLVRSLTASRRYQELSFFRLDMTSSVPKMILGNFQRKTGYRIYPGSLFYLRDGEVVSYVVSGAFETRVTLLERIEDLLQRSRG